MYPVNSETGEITDLALKLRPVFHKYGISKAILFGSFSRGDHSRRSDVDLMLIQKTAKRFLDRYDHIFVDIVELVHGRDVDLLIYTPEEIADMANRSFIQTILKEGIVIYESHQ